MNFDDPNFDFDQHFKDIQRQAQGGMKLVAYMVLAGWLLALSLLAGLLYVGWHFISKLW